MADALTRFIFLEEFLSRVINPESAGKDRTRLVKGVALALRQLVQQQDTGAQTRDLAAFIALALENIAETIEASVTPWEKRDYWVKADKFRMEWAWAGRLGKAMRQAVLADDWMSVARLSGEIAGKLGTIKLAERNRLGEPWVGAFGRLKETL